MTAREHHQAALWPITAHNRSFAQIKYEPACFQPGFDVDATRIETVSSDRNFHWRHAYILLQVVGVVMSVDLMLRDDVEQWSHIENVQ